MVVLTPPERAEPGGVPTLLSQQSVDKRIRYKKTPTFFTIHATAVGQNPHGFASFCPIRI